MGAIVGIARQCQPMQKLSRQQLVLLVLLTAVWGINWPVLKLGVTDFPALTFRAMSIWLGVPVLAMGLGVLKVPFRLPRRHWPELLWHEFTGLAGHPVGVALALVRRRPGRWGHSCSGAPAWTCRRSPFHSG